VQPDAPVLPYHCAKQPTLASFCDAVLFSPGAKKDGFRDFTIARSAVRMPSNGFVLFASWKLCGLSTLVVPQCHVSDYEITFDLT